MRGGYSYGGLCLVAGDSGATSSKADVASPDDPSTLTSTPGPVAGAGENPEPGAGGNPEPGADGNPPPATDQPKQEEEESDLQLSWEVLELARLICQRSVVSEVTNDYS